MRLAHAFEGSPVISRYSRAQAIEDGGLVDVSGFSRNIGFKVPVALTAAVWGDCVAWDTTYQCTHQDPVGRLADVLHMAAAACRFAQGNRVMFRLLRIPRGQLYPESVSLVAHIGPGDQGEPVITIMQPDED